MIPRLGGVAVEPEVEARVRASAAALIAANGMVEVDVSIELPNLAAQWMIGNFATLIAELGDRWPACAPDLTDEIAIGLYLSQSLYNLRAAAVAEELRVQRVPGDGGARSRRSTSSSPRPIRARRSRPTRR